MCIYSIREEIWAYSSKLFNPTVSNIVHREMCDLTQIMGMCINKKLATA